MDTIELNEKISKVNKLLDIGLKLFKKNHILNKNRKDFLEFLENNININLLCFNEIEFLMKDNGLTIFSEILNKIIKILVIIFNKSIFFISKINWDEINQKEIFIKNFKINNIEEESNIKKKKILIKKEIKVNKDWEETINGIRKKAKLIYDNVKNNNNNLNKLDYIDDPLLLLEINKLINIDLHNDLLKSSNIISNHLLTMNYKFDDYNISYNLKNIYLNMSMNNNNIEDIKKNDSINKSHTFDLLISEIYNLFKDKQYDLANEIYKYCLLLKNNISKKEISTQTTIDYEAISKKLLKKEKDYNKLKIKYIEETDKLKNNYEDMKISNGIKDNEIKKLNITIGILQEEIDSVSGKITKLNDTIINISYENRELLNELIQFKEKKKYYESKIKNLENRQQELEIFNKELDNENLEYLEFNDNLNDIINWIDIKNDNKNIQKVIKIIKKEVNSVIDKKKLNIKKYQILKNNEDKNNLELNIGEDIQNNIFSKIKNLNNDTKVYLNKFVNEKLKNFLLKIKLKNKDKKIDNMMGNEIDELIKNSIIDKDIFKSKINEKKYEKYRKDLLDYIDPSDIDFNLFISSKKNLKNNDDKSENIKDKSENIKDNIKDYYNSKKLKKILNQENHNEFKKNSEIIENNIKASKRLIKINKTFNNLNNTITSINNTNLLDKKYENKLKLNSYLTDKKNLLLNKSSIIIKEKNSEQIKKKYDEYIEKLKKQLNSMDNSNFNKANFLIPFEFFQKFSNEKDFFDILVDFKNNNIIEKIKDVWKKENFKKYINDNRFEINNDKKRIKKKNDFTNTDTNNLPDLSKMNFNLALNKNSIIKKFKSRKAFKELDPDFKMIGNSLPNNKKKGFKKDKVALKLNSKLKTLNLLK